MTKRSALLRLLGLLTTSLLFVSCGRGDAERDKTPILLLISLDGFRADYLERIAPPNLTALAESGVVAEALISSFPTKTFPNHYTIVTGLYPVNHGIVSNNMYDPDLEARFGLSRRKEVQRSDWWLGEPIWVTAEQQGIKAAPMFWPGSEAEIGGVRPSFWLPYDDDMTAEARLELFFEWVDLPEGERPGFFSMYFSDTDSIGHRHGPDSDELKEAVILVDRHIGTMVEGLAERGQPANLIVVSDHGMAATSPERVVLLDQVIDLAGLDVVDIDPVAMIRIVPPSDDRPDSPSRNPREIVEALDAHPNLTAYHRDDLPDEYRYSGNPRIPEVIAIADEGWRIAHSSRYERNPEVYRGGAHGYPPSNRSMDAFFLANGPDLKEAMRVPAFENVHIYELMSTLLRIEPAPNDGDPTVTASFLSGED